MVLRKLFAIDSNTNGKGPSVFEWSPSGQLLAIGGTAGKVVIVDRSGDVRWTVNLKEKGAVSCISWHAEGSTIAIMQVGVYFITTYDLTTKKTSDVDPLHKVENTAICFNRTSPAVLAVGSSKGGVLLMNCDTFQKIPIAGTHSKRIISMRWNKNDVLAVASEDKYVSFVDTEGKILDRINIKGEIAELHWANRKTDQRTKEDKDKERTISMTNNGKTLIMTVPQSKEALTELAFNKKYGNLIAFEWYGDGYLVVAFAAGNVAIVSTHTKEIGSEVSMMKSHRDALTGLCVNSTINKGAAIGDNFVRVFDLDDLQLSDQRSERYDFDAEFGALSRCAWTNDGQILTVSSRNGTVYTFLTRIPVLSASYGSYIIFLSSLRELSIRDVVTDTEVAKVEVEIEPAFAALSNGIAAVGMNNHVWYYSFSANGKPAKLICDRTYPNVVESVVVSPNYAAVLIDGGHAKLHQFEEKRDRDRSFPEKDPTTKVTTHAMTDNFYMFGTASGLFTIFSLHDHEIVTEYRHICGIRSIQPNTMGTRVAWVDQSGAGAVFNPATEVATVVDGIEASTERFLWDPTDYGGLVGVTGKALTPFVYAPNTRYGSVCTAIRKNGSEKAFSTPRPYGFAPVLMFRGVVVCQMPTGTLAPVPLQSHQAVHYSATGDPEAFSYLIQMFRLSEALAVANQSEQLSVIAEAALHILDVELAIRVYRQLCKPTMVMCLEKIRHIQEKNVLLGHISLIFRQFDDAQNFFTRSSNPMLALEMRRDLMHWDQALGLAENLAPDQVPILSREYAQQLEFRAEYAGALDMFNRGYMQVPELPPNPSPMAVAQATAAEHHNEACQGGAARCMLRIGNIRGGMQLAMKAKNKQLIVDCAVILESIKQYEEAAQLFERAEKWERAATIYIRDTKQLKSAARVMPNITSRNILVMYAKAKETTEHAYQEAEQAYTKAEDWDNVVRIKVENLNDVHGAYVLVRKTRSSEAASMVARVCQKRGDITAAVEFLLLAKKKDEAFEVAKKHNAMTAFETALLQQVALVDGVAPAAHRDTFALIAQHYEDVKNFDVAGDFYRTSGNFSKALQMYLDTNSDDAIEKAINVVGRSANDTLAHRLLDFLTGDVDGVPKDPKNIFKLYMALGSYEKAAKMAVLIATREQELGNYRPAHKILIDTTFVLHGKGMRVSTDLRRALMLLHSYIIVKHLVKPMDDLPAATRMLLRVSRNIQKFPEHTATILTSTVLQCVKAEFRASAYEYAVMLVQTPELREQIPEKHKKKVETVVRRRNKDGELIDPPEPTSLCPFCSAPVPETALDCAACKNVLPFCIVTGKHMISSDWCECPSCHFPALHSEFLKLLKYDPRCPLCDHDVDPMKLNKVENPDVKSHV